MEPRPRDTQRCTGPPSSAASTTRRAWPAYRGGRGPLAVTVLPDRQPGSALAREVARCRSCRLLGLYLRGKHQLHGGELPFLPLLAHLRWLGVHNRVNALVGRWLLTWLVLEPVAAGLTAAAPEGADLDGERCLPAVTALLVAPNGPVHFTFSHCLPPRPPHSPSVPHGRRSTHVAPGRTNSRVLGGARHGAVLVTDRERPLVGQDQTRR